MGGTGRLRSRRCWVLLATIVSRILKVRNVKKVVFVCVCVICDVASHSERKHAWCKFTSTAEQALAASSRSHDVRNGGYVDKS